MSFVDVGDVIALSEGLMKVLFESITGATLTLPMRRMEYTEAMERYGSDKPDLRFDLPLEELTPLFQSTAFGVFKKTVEAGGAIKGLALRGKSLSRKDLDTAVDTAKAFGAGGLIWMRKEGGKLLSPIVKYLSEIEVSSIESQFDLSEGDVLFIMADERSKVNDVMGRMRLYLAERYALTRDEYSFLWVVDFPLFEYSEEEKRYVALHHPFTSPKESLRGFNGDYTSLRAKAYDLVLNGVELGGGSIRNFRREEQMEMFRLLGHTEEEAYEQFGFLLEALEMGAPPHGGIAFGFDRILMILLGLESIRDVIPFPKTQKGTCLLSGAPAPVKQKQLNELKIRVLKE